MALGRDEPARRAQHRRGLAWVDECHGVRPARRHVDQLARPLDELDRAGQGCRFIPIPREPLRRRQLRLADAELPQLISR